ncbi:MAG: hypothetical protein F6K21_23960 [Symploca sp. SIO2D2]|nr:hypothetical protein [Symploca sp. SIO2D2]
MSRFRIFPVLFAGCLLNWDLRADVELPEPKGDLLLAIELKESAFTGVHDGRHGFYLYIEDAGAFVGGPLVTGYRYKEGKQVDAFGGGSSGSVWFMQRLETLGLQNFDFDAASSLAQSLRSQEDASNSLDEVPPVGMNDGVYLITFYHEGVSYEIEATNPGSILRSYAAYNEDISRLNELVILMASYYGLMKIGM